MLVVLLVKEGTTLNVRMERGREKRERYRWNVMIISNNEKKTTKGVKRHTSQSMPM